MENNREPRSNKSTNTQSINIWQVSQEFIQGRDSVFMKWFCENWTYKCKRMKLDLYLTQTQKPCKMDQRKIRPDTTNLPVENTRDQFFNIGLDHNFWDLTRKTQATKDK